MDDQGRLLTSKEIEELMKTKEGCKLIKSYAISAMVAYSAQEGFNYLTEINKNTSEMTYSEIQEFCTVLFLCMRYPKWQKIEAYLVEACAESKKLFDKEDYEQYMEC